MGLYYVPCIGFLGKIDRHRAIIVGRPLKVCSEEPVDGSHEFDLKLGSKQAFKATLNLWVLGEVDKIFHIEAQVERLVRGPGLVARELCGACGVAGDGGRRYVLVEARVVQNGYEDQVN